MTLRNRLVLIIAGVVFTVIVVISGYFLRAQQRALAETTANESAKMREALQRRGLALARNVALASERAVAVLDFLFLSDVVDSTVRHDPDFVYGLIMDANGKVLVHTQAERIGTVLRAAADLRAAAAPDVMAQELPEGGVLDVSSPISVGGKRWGTARFGISLRTLDAEIGAIEQRANARIAAGVRTTALTALLLIVLGSALGAMASRSVTAPLSRLMAVVRGISEGRLDERVEVGGASELQELASAFNQMTRAVRERDDTLRENMTHVQRALDTAREADRLKSEFLANISHELRTPLNAIVNVPNLLLDKWKRQVAAHCAGCGARFEADGDEVDDARCPDCGTLMTIEKRLELSGDPAEAYHFLVRLQQSGKHLLNVVNDLLDFSKLEAGKMRLHRERVFVDVIMAELHATVSTLAAQKRIELCYPTARPSLALDADPVKLVQILINLVGNAVKFTPVGGRITITAEANGEQIEFGVSDTGRGIPKDQLEAIFESFRQVDGSHTRREGGTGLGLAITRQLVELHGGHVWASSELGKGSTFHVRLPLGAPVNRRGEVAIVDDNQIQLEVAGLILERMGFAPRLLSDPRDVLKLTAAPSFIILDVMMPEVSGLAVLEELKAHPTLGQVRVIVATAYHSNERAVKAAGALWMPKPWSASDLAQLLQEAAS